MKKIICLVGITLLTVALMTGVALSAYEKAPEQIKGLVITVLLGTINNLNQLVDINGQTFNVKDNEEGMKLFSHTGQKVLVSGSVMERDGKNQITVLEYKLIPENPDY
jgi:hypothetical protein